MPSLIQKHAHVKGQRSNHHTFKFQPNPSWAKKRPNRYTSFNGCTCFWRSQKPSPSTVIFSCNQKSGQYYNLQHNIKTKNNHEGSNSISDLNLLRQGLLDLEFYGGLVYKLTKIVGTNICYVHSSKITISCTWARG